MSHSCCVLRVIVLLEGEPSAQSEVLNALDWAFIKAISIFWSIELFFYSDESLSPCRWKTAPQHEAPSVALFGQEASSRNSPGCFKLLPLRVTKTTFFCDPSMKQNFFWTLPQMCGLTQTCFWSIQAVILTPGLGFCSDMHHQLLDLLLRCVCLSKSYPFNLIYHRLPLEM